MKIRNGFVSNSSSSSFVCIGIQLTDKAKKELLKQYPMTDAEKEGYDEDDPSEYLAEKLDMGVFFDQGVVYLGEELGSVTEIKDLMSAIEASEKKLGNIGKVKLYSIESYN